MRDLSATTPEDYLPPARPTVSFPIGFIEEEVTMTILPDASIEDTEVFEISIHDPSDGNLGEVNKATVYLYDPPSMCIFLT